MIKNKKQLPEVETTGHEWDGITEYDNPDPIWLRIIFYIMLFFSIGYWFLYPSWPTPNDEGILGWTSVKETQEGLVEMQKKRSVFQAEFDKASFEEIINSPKLLKFAEAGGQSAFRNNCAMCHGAGGGGNLGYPNLTAGAWLWGGKVDDIYTTLKHGIRASDDDTRQSIMAAFGRDKILTPQQIELLVPYVLSLHTGADSTREAHTIFQENCSSCHGAGGVGNKEFGAPALNDAIWLYGGDEASIYESIYNGRAGVMPYWSNRLDDSTLRQLSVYVHQLGGGE